MRCCPLLVPALVLLFAAPLSAENTVEVIKQPLADKAVSPAIAKLLAPTGVRVTADGKTVCEVWLAKQWSAKPKFSPTFSVLYPFEVGELLGVVRYPQEGADFRDQQIAAGVYTIRYGQQPEDGNHVGTSDTRDFCVLLPAKKDTDPGRMDMMRMIDLSTEVSQSTHPAILSMLAAGGGQDKLPALRHDEDRDLWSVRVKGRAKAGEEAKDLAVEFVVVGHAAE